MDRASVLSGAAFRGALYGGAVFLCILTVCAVLVYANVRGTLLSDLEEQILDTRALVVEMREGQGLLRFLSDVDALAERLSATQGIVAVVDPAGRVIAGTPGLRAPGSGWRRVEGAAWEGRPLGTGLAHIGSLGPLTLIVGRSAKALDEVERTLMISLAGLGTVMTLTLVAIGYALSHAAQAKLSAIEGALDRVSRGDMTARAPVSAHNDQIDRVARKINAHLQRLSELMSATRNAAASIAHDLRTPLSRAYLAADRVLERLNRGDPALDEAEALAAELGDLAAVFDTILRIARIDTDRDPAGVAPVDLCDVLREVAEAYGPLAEDRGQAMELSLPDAPVTVPGDDRMLRQMLANLVQNAITHAPHGARIGMAVQAGPPPRLVVSDTGSGIPEADRERVFDPFVRLDGSRSSPGSGLGLALVRAVAGRHGATVTLADNAPGLRVTVAFAEG